MLRLAHYSAGDGFAGFVLDRSGTPLKLRFDGSKEILALSAVPATRGSTSLQRDDGWVLLRIDDNGGVTLFGDAARDGVRKPCRSTCCRRAGPERRMRPPR